MLTFFVWIDTRFFIHLFSLCLVQQNTLASYRLQLVGVVSTWVMCDYDDYQTGCHIKIERTFFFSHFKGIRFGWNMRRKMDRETRDLINMSCICQHAVCISKKSSVNKARGSKVQFLFLHHFFLIFFCRFIGNWVFCWHNWISHIKSVLKKFCDRNEW